MGTLEIAGQLQRPVAGFAMRKKNRSDRIVRPVLDSRFYLNCPELSLATRAPELLCHEDLRGATFRKPWGHHRD